MENIFETTEKKMGFDKALYTKIVWAGRRRYFFDILSTRAGDRYISITESRKKQNQNGEVQFENQKIFLFKEDFEKFADAFGDVLNQLKGVCVDDKMVAEVSDCNEYQMVDLDFENL